MIHASNVTVKNVQVVTGGNFGISLYPHHRRHDREFHHQRPERHHGPGRLGDR